LHLASKKTTKHHLHLQTRLLKIFDNKGSCVIAGALMSLCFAPFHFWWLCCILLIPLIVTCKHADADTRIIRGGLFGIAYFGIGSYWLTQTLVTQVNFSWFSAILSNIVIAAACALAPSTFCWIAGYMRQVSICWIILLPALWVLTEDIRFLAFGGGPWMSLGLSQIDSPLAGYYPLVGEVGTSGIVILLSYLLVELLGTLTRKSSGYSRLLYSVIFSIVLIAGFWSKQQAWTTSVGPEIRLAMVQSATSQADKINAIDEIKRLHQLRDLSQPHLGKSDLVIWPETVVTLEKHKIQLALKSLDHQAKKLNTTLLIGAFEADLNQHRYNSAYTIGLEGNQSYRKRHLVPFGEYVPSFLSLIDPHVPGDNSRNMGKTPQLIAIAGQLFGVSICWEGGFSRDISPLVRSGASVLVNVANEAWFAESALPRQNLDAMRVRAIETGRPAIRVANMGPGALVDSAGRVLVSLAANKAGSVNGLVQPKLGATPFVTLGEDFIFFFALILVTGIALLQYKSKNNYDKK